MTHGFLALISILIMVVPSSVAAQDVLLSKDICDTVRKHMGTAEIQDHFNAQSAQNVVGFPIDIPLQLDLQETQFAGFLPDELNTEAILTNLKVHADGTVEFQGDNVRFVPDEFCKEGEITGGVARSNASFTTDKDLLSKKDLLAGNPQSDTPATLLVKPAIQATPLKAPKELGEPVKPAPKVALVPPKPSLKPAPPPSVVAKVPPQTPKVATIPKQDVDLTAEKGEILEGRAN